MVTTFSGKLEKSENCQMFREMSEKMQKVREKSDNFLCAENLCSLGEFLVRQPT